MAETPTASVVPDGSGTGINWKTVVGAIVVAYLLRKLLTSGKAENPPRKLTISEIEDWIDNDEGLNDWWWSSKMGKRKFIRENRVELEAAIQKVLGGEKPAHFLKYGPVRYEATNPARDGTLTSFREWYDENKNSQFTREDYDNYRLEMEEMGFKAVSFKRWMKRRWKERERE